MASARVGSRKGAFGEAARKVSMLSAAELRKVAVGDAGKDRPKAIKELVKRGLSVAVPEADSVPDVV